ncbi:MAG: AraC family transcriptional regulator [Clostridiales bacterium]|nr:AraC family transcriptional regulator [Clostridiales bacterium]
MDNYLMETIKSTTAFIEDHLLEDLNLDMISENVNISKFHLLRIWKGATGTSLMEYVRRRRIALSLSDLLNQRNSIEFISSKYSFGCDRTYNRAFKDEYNTTPAKWRRNPCLLKILDRFNAEFLNCVGEGVAHLCTINVLPDFSIAGYAYTIDNGDNGETANRYAVDFFKNSRQKVFNPVQKDVYIGFSCGSENSCGSMLYLPSVQVGHKSIVPPDMTVKMIKSHKYGVFTYMGLHRPEEISKKKLRELLYIVHHKWMPTVAFDPIEPFSFEYIDYAKCSRYYCECQLYFPISAL